MHFHAIVLSLAAVAAIGSAALAQDPITGTSISGHIDSITIDNPADVFSGGRIVVAGQSVIIPRNLLIDLPANRLTLQQLFADAPSAARTGVPSS
jgi:transcription termination factor Rho